MAVSASGLPDVRSLCALRPPDERPQLSGRVGPCWLVQQREINTKVVSQVRSAGLDSHVRKDGPEYLLQRWQL